MELKTISSGGLKLSGNKLLHHPEEIEKWQRGEPFAPIMIEFGPVSYCNHKCIHCYVMDEMRGDRLDSDVYLKFVKDAGDFGVKSIILGGCGEPMLHPKTPEALEVGVKHGLNFGMYTNGVPITERNTPQLIDNLTFIRFSINGFSNESHQFIHDTKNSDLDKVKKNLEGCIEYKRKNDSECTIGVYCVLFNENLDDVYEGTKWLRDIGVDYALFKPISQGTGNIQHIQAANLENHPTLVSDLETLQTDDFHVTVRADLIRDGYVRLGYDRCYGLPFECAIDADGSVYTCNWYWGKEEFKYGNLNDNSFPEIWESEKAKSLRSHVSSPEFKIGNCCGSCKQNSINKTLYQINHNPDKAREIEETLKSPGITPQHVNFL